MDKLSDTSLKGSPGVVLCDLFDTLILRMVHPEHVKKLAARRLRRVLNLKCHPESLYQLRAQIERDLCRQNLLNGFDLDFNFDAFAEIIHDALKRKEPEALGRLELAAFAQTLCAVELQVETSVQRIDPSVVACLREFAEQRIPIYAISDFYLPRRMIIELLRHHRVDSLFLDVFVSSESLVAKRSGRLYDLVLQSIGVSPHHVVMIGDNEEADHVMALRRGINAFLVDRTQLRKFYSDFSSDYATTSKVAKKLSAAALGRTNPTAERSSRKVYLQDLALTLWGFVHKLHALLTHRGVRDVYFLSREGWFLRRLFDIYQEYEGRGVNPARSHYLQASRRSTLLPSLGPIDQEQFPALFPQYRRTSLSDFLGSLNFDDDEVAYLSNTLQVDSRTQFPNFPESDVFARLRRESYFRALYEKKRLEQRRNFCAYLNLQGVDLKKGELHLVDVGWKGTIQDNIFRALAGFKTIRGYYLGLIAEENDEPNNTKTGVLFSRWPKMSRYYRVFSENRTLFEIVLGADHPSVDKYEVVRELPEAVYFRDPEEIEWYHHVIEPIQKSIETSFRTICDTMSQSHFLPDDFDDLVAKKHARLVFFPTREELNFFRSLHHKENFGVFGVTRFGSDEGMNCAKRVGNLWKVMSDPRGVLQAAWWKPLTFRNMGLGFLGPMYGSYRYVQSFMQG
ncbi:MAG: HAD-IA family hydrolase [Desulfomonilaceae bacterium]